MVGFNKIFTALSLPAYLDVKKTVATREIQPENSVAILAPMYPYEGISKKSNRILTIKLIATIRIIILCLPKTIKIW